MNEAQGGEGLELSGVAKTFRQAGKALPVLKGTNLKVGAGELVALVGPSGSGKSTLLHIAGLLESPDEGRIRIAGEDCGNLDETGRTRLRRNRIGFVYQYHHLLPEFSARENVVLPQMIAGQNRGKAKSRADELLAAVGLSERANHRPARLSGGEQQRVAIVRALANAPAVLLADEPTGNLDPHTADQVFAHLVNLVRKSGLAALIATHNPDLAARMDRTLVLADGAVQQA